jgi:hypothetical protein
MKTDKTDSLRIGLAGSWGTATIDWGVLTYLFQQNLFAQEDPHHYHLWQQTKYRRWSSLH